MLTFLSAVTFRSLSIAIFWCILLSQNNCKQGNAGSNLSKQNGNGSTGNSNAQTSQAKNLSLYCPEGNAFYVLFYANPLNDPAGKQIRDLRPNFVITADSLYKNQEVPSFFHKDGQSSTNIRAISYLTVKGGGEALEGLLQKIEDSMNAGYDGVFFDEVEDESSEEKQLNYYAEISKKVKFFGKNKLVIFNPGKKRVKKWVFNYADIVSVENNGIENGMFDQPHTTNPEEKYPSWRWLSVLGDPSKYAAKDAGEANQRLKSFRNNGGLWFYSPPYCDDPKVCPDHSSHYHIPDWLEKFAAEAKKETVKCK
jgi:hypothetical protein